VPEPWSLLVLVVAVAVGLVTVTLLSVIARSWPTAFFRALLLQLLLFNLLILGGLVVQYLAGSDGGAGGSGHPGLTLGLLAALVPPKLAWLAAFGAMTLVLPGQELPERFRGVAVISLAGLLGLCALVLALGAAMDAFARTLVAVITAVEVVVLVGAILACVWLLARGRALPSGPRRRSIALLAGGYLTIFGVMMASLVAGWVRPAAPVPSQVTGGVVLMACNLLPLVWILRFQPKGPLAAADSLDRYGISPREREIIALVADGCTNQEVADRLFISLATVKDHNYNIFRKMGVRNRVELVNLVRGGRTAER
jgi:DNA-binding CsgD family transcriptional regulator